MTSSYDKSDWREASRGEPCPICTKGDWCSLTGAEGDPEAVVCMRIESDNKRPNGGWLHRLRADPPAAVTPTRRPTNHSAKPAAQAKVYPTLDSAIAGYANLGAPDRQWQYRDAAGEVALVVLRWDARDTYKKTIRPVRRVAGGWKHEQPPAGRPLYRLPELAASDCTVFIVEGEPAADALVAAGMFHARLVATTSSGGSKAAALTDWSPLAGRDVVLLPDNDKPGREYQDDVLARLAALTPQPTVRVVELPGLPEKGDAVDWLTAGGTARELQHLVADAPLVELAAPERPLVYRPFPTALLPEAMRRFVDEAAAAIGCDPAMVALPALAAAAGAIGATRVLRLKRTWYEPAVLWCVVVSPSGAMKSQGRKLVLAPILKRQKRELAAFDEAMRAFGPLQATYEKELGQWKRSKSGEPPPAPPEKPVLRELLISDTTVEAVAKALRASPRGLLLDRDELAAWFGSFDRYASGGGDAQNWMNMHGAGFVKVNRAGMAAPIFIDRACVSVSGTIQPAILTESLTKSHRESGLAARLLIANPPRRAKRWTDDEVSEEVERQFADHVLDLLDLDFTTDDDGEPLPVALRLTASAQRRWRDHVNRHGAEGLDREGDELAAWSKLEGYAARFALVLALFDNPAATTVDDDTLARAIALMEWFAHEAARFYRGATEKAVDRELRELAEWIDVKSGGAVTPRELVQGRRSIKTVDEAEAAIARLIGANYGDWRLTPTATKTRREFVLAGSSFTLAGSSTSTDSPEAAARVENVDVDAHEEPESAPDDDGWEAA